MTRAELAEILKYSHPKELYIIDWKNRLVVLRCPFKVMVKKDIGYLKKHEIVKVDSVKVTLELITVYVVEEQLYFYYHFEILSE